MKFLSQINVNTEYTLPFVDGNNGQVLTTDGQGAVYWGSVSAGATSLDGLTDVEITSPQAGQILNYSVPLGGTVPVWRNITSPYAPIASPTFTGTPAAPTAPTATNTTQIATTAFVKAQGYLTSYTETDPTVPSHVKSITTTNITNWNAAYDDSIRAVAFNTTNGVLTLTQQDAGTLTVDLDGRYLTSFSESDPVFEASAAASITNEDIAAWDTAYGWGNHADYGYLTSLPVHSHTIADVTGLQAALDGRVPTTRTLTINGTSYDLSANRSWTIATTDSTKVSKSGESHDTVEPNNLGAGDGGFYTVKSGFGPSGGNDALIHIPYSNSDWAHQLAFDWALGNNQDMWFRTKNGGTWQGWRKVWHDGNFTDNSTNWNTAYNDRITAAAVTGTSTKTLTLTQGDGGTVTATWTDYDTDNDAQVLTWTAPSKELEISNGNSITLDGLATEDYVLSQGFTTFQPWNSGTGSINYTAGNVGIGTTSPAGKLSVEGNGTEYSNIVFKQSGAQEHLIYASENSQYNLIGSGAPIWIWGQQGGTEKMRLNNTGLGIGTTNPSGKLHVVGPINIERTGVANVYSTVDMEGNFRFNASDGYAHTFLNNGSELVRIMPSGNVGIGNTSPTAKLQVGAEAHPNATGIEVAAGTGGANLLAIDNANNHNWLPYVDGQNYYSAAAHTFRNATHNVNWMHISSGGNVGIGTTTPTQKLHVAGNGLFEKIGIGSINTSYDLYNNGTSYFNGEVIVDDRLYLTGGISQSNIVGRPKLYWGVGGTTTGAVTIKFPGGFSNYGMIHAVIDIYEYSGNNVCTIIVGGHNWNGRWYSYGANVVGYTDKPVRVAYRESRYEIIIGDNNSSWSYGQVVLRKIQNGNYYAGVMNVSDGYEIEQIADVTAEWISEDLRSLKTAGHLTVNGGASISGTTNTDGTVYIYGKDAFQGGDSWLRLNQSGNFTSGVYTPAGLRNDGAFENYGGIYGYNTIRGRKAQTNNDYTTAALWTESYNNTTTGIAFHISGNVGKFLEMRTDGVLYWENAKVWTAATDGSGSGLDADTVDGIHASTFATRQDGARYSTDVNSLMSSGFYNVEGQPANSPVSYGQIIVAKGIDTAFQIAGGYSNNALYFRGQGYGPESGGFYPWRRVWHNDDFSSTNISNWNAAYNDRITAVAVSGTGTKTLTLTQQDGGTLTATWTDFDSDTDQQELTWEQGTSTLSISNGNAVILSGFATEDYVLSQGFVTSAGTVAGVVRTVTGTNSAELVRGNMGDNDQARILVGATASNAGYLEIATADDGTEPIYVRQYTGVFSSLTRTATLLDGSGNTTFPGNLTIGGTFTENSSIRFKENIQPLEPSLAKVEQLNPVTYNKIGVEQEEIGLIAEEVAELFPEVVTYNENGQPSGVQYQRLSVILLKAVQELSNEVKELKAKLK